MKISTYKSLMTNKRTWVIVANKVKCGYKGYRELQIMMVRGQWEVYETDGYKLDLVRVYSSEKALKSIINLHYR